MFLRFDFFIDLYFKSEKTHLCYHEKAYKEASNTNAKKKEFTETVVLKEGRIHVGDCCDQRLLIYKLWW